MAIIHPDTSAATCARKGCISGDPIRDRHHKGCQGMWVRHFAHHAGKRYRNFVERYESYHENDVVRICRTCHGEIHRLLITTIRRRCIKLGDPHDWSWGQARELINDCVRITNKWLQTKPSVRHQNARESSPP